MQRTIINGIQLEYEVFGTGEPVLLIHGAFVADSFAPIIRGSDLSKDYKLICYHRRGYGNSRSATVSAGVSTHARDSQALMHHLGIKRAHIVGHSFGALVALQLAIDMPECVHSLVLLEAAIPSFVLNSPKVAEAASRAFPMYLSGDKAAALDAFIQGIAGPEYRAVFEQAMPKGAYAQVLADLDNFILADFPAWQTWTLATEAVSTIKQPVLVVVGANSFLFMQEVFSSLQEWFPQAETFVLPNASHMLMIENPSDMAIELKRFFANHPMSHR